MNVRDLAGLAAVAVFVGCGASQAPSPPSPAATPVVLATPSSNPPPPPVPKTWPYPMGGSVSPSPHGAVASDCALATKAGLAMLQRGGNAVDAAVTTAFALAVAYPTAGNLGGGGFAVVHFAGDDRTLDFRGPGPAAA